VHSALRPDRLAFFIYFDKCVTGKGEVEEGGAGGGGEARASRTAPPPKTKLEPDIEDEAKQMSTDREFKKKMEKAPRRLKKPKRK
jgi:hypothetical protein